MCYIERLLNDGSYESLCKIIKTIYLRNKDRLNKRRRITEKDTAYFERVENILYSEFSIALNMTYDDMKEYAMK